MFKARDEHSGKIVAIKILPPKSIKDEATVARFRRVMEAVSQLQHPNIIAAFDVGEVDGRHYLVMEYVDGCDLSVIVTKRGPIAVNDAVNYIRQAASGLAHAHSQGLVHGDIKPASLLLDKKGVVRIVDLGHARFEGPTEADAGLNQLGRVTGAVDDRAPEQVCDAAHHVDALSDVYKLGCTLYRLLTGKGLYSGKTKVQKILTHREHVVSSLRTVCPAAPRSLDNLYQRMVAKDPSQRPTMSELVTAPGTIAEEQRQTTNRVATSDLNTKPRRRLLVASAAAGLLLLASGIVLLVLWIMQ